MLLWTGENACSYTDARRPRGQIEHTGEDNHGRQTHKVRLLRIGSGWFLLLSVSAQAQRPTAAAVVEACNLRRPRRGLDATVGGFFGQRADIQLLRRLSWAVDASRGGLALSSAAAVDIGLTSSTRSVSARLDRPVQRPAPAAKRPVVEWARRTNPDGVTGLTRRFQVEPGPMIQALAAVMVAAFVLVGLERQRRNPGHQLYRYGLASAHLRLLNMVP